MWGTQGWNQWALQPAMFNDVPHEQIDWAALAKQWIQMQQTQPPDAAPPPAPPPPAPAPAPAPAIIPPPPGHMPLVPEDFGDGNVTAPLLKAPLPPGAIPEPFHPERSFENEPAPFLPKSVDTTYWSKSQWEASAAGDIDERLWTAPPIEAAAPPPPPPPLLGGKETFDYGHMHDNPPLAMQSIDYNHMSDYSYNQVYTPETQYDQYWSQVNAAPTISPMFLKKERIGSNLPAEEDTTQIDAAKRKQLPAWIRDGLEKMEQERLKRLERERAAKEKAEKLAKTASIKKDLDIKTDSATIAAPLKSKFESDSDLDGDDDGEVVEKNSSPSEKRAPSPLEDSRTEEEKKQELMLRVRRMLTEILLSVTNSEMLAIAQEVYRKAMSKAPARQLASSTSLTTVASGLRGLASYGTESEASDAEEENDASDSEEELYRRIKEKKKLFAVKERKIIADLERKELEERTEIEKPKHENNGKHFNKEFLEAEKLEKLPEDANIADKNHPTASLQSSMQLPSSPKETPFSVPENKEVITSNNDLVLSSSEALKTKIEDESNSSDSSSSSSDSDSGSNGKSRRKADKERESRKETDGMKRTSKKDKSPVRRENRHRHSRSRDSDSSDKHKKTHSYEKSKRSSSYKKRKKYKRSDSSSSSSSANRKRKHSSKSDSNHNHRERRSRSHDDRGRKHRRSRSSSRSYHRSESHSYKSSHYRHEDRDKYDRRHRDEKRYHESKRSPSPYRHSTKLPKKYRSSRSLSSESESSGKKSKKTRNR